MQERKQKEGKEATLPEPRSSCGVGMKGQAPALAAGNPGLCGPKALARSPGLGKALGSSVPVSVEKQPESMRAPQGTPKSAGGEHPWPTPCRDLGGTCAQDQLPSN